METINKTARDELIKARRNHKLGICLLCGNLFTKYNSRHVRCGNKRKKGTCAYSYRNEWIRKYNLIWYKNNADRVRGRSNKGKRIRYANDAEYRKQQYKKVVDWINKNYGSRKEYTEHLKSLSK